jgi:plastocyanin
MQESSRDSASMRTPVFRMATTSVLIALAACDPDAQGATQVKMHDNAFNAPVVRIPTGAGVIFANAGRNPHNIVPVDPARWGTAVTHGDGAAGADTAAVAPGGEATLAFDAPGVYAYYCAYHGTKDGQGMAGTIVVGDTPYDGGPKGRLAAVDTATGTVRRVPTAYPTIQGAVDAAVPGDLVLVDSGIYREEVQVSTPSLVIRGVDRNAVIVDGEFVRPNGFNVLADGVAIENLTARNHTFNGVFWTGVTGYRGRYLTAYNNGDYGIYAFDSQDGLIEDSYASGSPDAGFYIGQCDPCRAVIRRVLAEHNAVGYSGTNSSGDLYILSSTWRYNRGGLVPNSLDTELHPPQHVTVIRGNLIHDNHSRTAPGKGLSPLAWGNGVVIGGGRDNLVADNVIADHAGHGVMVAPLVDAHWWPATGNRVAGNTIINSGRADISVGGPTSVDNCIAAQRIAVTTAPRALRCVRAAATSVTGDSSWQTRGEQNDLVPALALAMRMWRLRAPEYPDWRTQPVPPPQPTMPDARTAPAPPAVHVFAGVADEVTDAPLPAAADSVLAAARARGTPPAETPSAGRWFALLQAWMPLTLARLGAVLLLLAVWGRRIARGRRASADVQAFAGARRAWRLAVAVVLAWVGLTVAVAVSFSAM